MMWLPFRIRQPEHRLVAPGLLHSAHSVKVAYSGSKALEAPGKGDALSTGPNCAVSSLRPCAIQRQ